MTTHEQQLKAAIQLLQATMEDYVDNATLDGPYIQITPTTVLVVDIAGGTKCDTSDIDEAVKEII